MSTEMEWTCDDCGQTFWGPSDLNEQFEDVLCDECAAEYTDTVEAADTALVPASPTPDTALALGLPNEADFANELRYWVNEAHTDYPVPAPTFWQSITGQGNDAEYAEDHRKWAAGQTVKQILKREKAMLDGIKEAQIARMQAEGEIMAWRNYLIELHLYQQRLLEQARLIRERPVRVPRKKVAPTPEPEEIETDPEINFVMDRQRKKAREKAMADQAVISEFLNSVRRVFNDDTLENGERAMRIRSFMDAFGKGPEDLPAIVRNFLEEMESTGGEG